MIKEQVDVLVIGAGPSGCVAASYLYQKGVKVKVLEKALFPRFVIGESLLPRCMDHFEETGLLDCLKAKGYEVKSGARFMRKEDPVCLFDFSKKFTEGWDWTWQVPRADFDNTLAQEVIRKGVDLEFESEVTGVEFDGHKSETTYKDKNGESKVVKANFIIDSSGYGRVLPRLLGLDKPSEMPKNSSVFTHIKDLRRPEGKEGTMITFDVIDKDVWLWVIPFSNGITSIGFVGANEFIDSYSDDTTEALQEMMKLSTYYYDRFEGIDYEFKPYKFRNLAKAVTQLHGEGYALTGNSAEFLDPVFSSGVTFATESGIRAAKLVTRQLNNETVDWDVEYSKYIKKGVGVFGSYVKEWYNGNLQKLFFHRPENQAIKEKICAVLAGYVWDNKNPFVRQHSKIVSSVAKMIDMDMEQRAGSEVSG